MAEGPQCLIIPGSPVTRPEGHSKELLRNGNKRDNHLRRAFVQCLPWGWWSGYGRGSGAYWHKSKILTGPASRSFQTPTAKMNAGGMPAIDLPPDDLKALIAYVESLK
jgi:hypothetical protein